MKNQVLFSSKDKSKKLKCRLLQFLFGAFRVKFFFLIWPPVVTSEVNLNFTYQERSLCTHAQFGACTVCYTF